MGEIIICTYERCGTTGHTAEEKWDITVCHKAEQGTRQ